MTSTHTNDSSRRNDSTMPPRANHPAEPGHLAPSRKNTLDINGSISGAGSPSDSILDLYSTGAAKSATNSIDHGERGRKATPGALFHEDDPGWIHRDKLARIESRELQAAGITLPRTRAYSKTGRKDRSREPSVSGLGRNEQHQRIQRVESPTAEEQEDEEIIEWDFRSPEEIAADINGGYSNLAKGSSKIPLSLRSPLPIPLQYIERDAPVQRSRSAAWSGEDDSIAYPLRDRQPAKAPSEEPAPILQMPPAGKRQASAESSPKKAVTPAARKTSGPNAKTPLSTHRSKSRSVSNARPLTRSGENTVKKPEGDPPWLATMYKPDPRLPPDQQMLPTVAKRLQQEQWEKEGKFGNAYDRDFRPLNDDEIQQPEIIQHIVEVPASNPDEQGEWPLRTPKSPDFNLARPGTSGGYSTLPKIRDAPPILMQSPKVQQQPVEQEQLNAKKGCGCCIVM